MTTSFLPHDIEQEEGCRLSAYLDTLGVPTIGIGHTGPHVHLGMTWTEAEALAQLASDVQTAIRSITASPVLQPVYASLDDIRQDAFVQMAYQMGAATLATFHATLQALRAGDYASAAAHMLQSKWAVQTPARARRMAHQIQTGQRAWQTQGIP